MTTRGRKPWREAMQEPGAIPEQSPIAGLDREIDLHELLYGLDHSRLLDALQILAGGALRLLDREGDVLLGDAEEAAGTNRAALQGELEPIGYLEADLPEEKLEALRSLLALLLKGNARYLMASELHGKTEASDYAELQREHTLLLESEARYKSLAEQLEQRVQEQVRTIETAQRKIYLTEKLASVGRLASGMAHEINTPLAFIQTNLHTAKDYLETLDNILALAASGKDGDTLQAACREADIDFVLDDFDNLVSESLTGVGKISTIVTNLTGFSSADKGDVSQVNINDTLEQACRVVIPQIGDQVRIIRNFGPLPPVTCHAGQLGQVFSALLINAAEATTGGGEVRLQSEARDGSVRVTVTDQGHGMDAQVVSRIFEPFFTTKDVGQGMGLGLSVCYDIIRSHGGTIEVESRSGEGSTFTVCIPLEPPQDQGNGPDN